MKWLGLAVALAACGGSGPSQVGGADAQRAITAASTARAGAPWDDEGEVEGEALRARRAARGLAISPVRIDTDRMDARRRQQVGLGSYLVNAAGDCTGCHTTNPAAFLGGGVPFALDAQGHQVWTRNLTPDPATGMKLTLAQFKEAIRTGRDFHPGATRMLVVMPWAYLRWESDADLEAIYAYLRAIPPVVNAVPPDDKDALPLPAAVPFPGFYDAGDVSRPLPADRQSFSFRRGLAISPLTIPATVRGGPARAFGVGSYLANATIACNECHTNPDTLPGTLRIDTAAHLTGGAVFTTPPPLRPVTGYVRVMSANLEGASHGFFSEAGESFDLFQGILQTGTLVDETPPRPLGFPMFLVAHSLGNLIDPDLRALHTYLSLTTRTAGLSDVERQPPARFCSSDLSCRAGEACTAGECTGGACGTDADCGACQTCEAGVCQAPLPTSACLLTAR